MSKISILSEKQIFGKRQLDIFKKIGLTCELTDFSILLGSNGCLNNNPNGAWWSSYVCKNGNFLDFSSKYLYTAVNPLGKMIFINNDSTHIGVRPTLPFSLINSLTANNLFEKDGVMEIEFGEYPQNIVSEELANDLENRFTSNSLILTGKHYSTISSNNNAKEQFNTLDHAEYYYNGKKYIRVCYDSCSINKFLPDGREIQHQSSYWVEVKPIKWFVDIKSNLAISEKILFSGVCFDNRDKRKVNFKKSFLKHYIDEYFSKDIVPSIIDMNRINNNDTQKEDNLNINNFIQEIKNAYNFNEENKEYIEDLSVYEQDFSQNKKSR